MKRHFPRVFSIFLCLCLVLSSLVAVSAANIGRRATGEARTRYSLKQSGITFAKSYADVYSALSAARQSFGDYRYAVADGAAPAPTGAAEAPEDESTAGSGKENYSGTNVQVEGIDEGDIVKTDGNYIYTLHNYELIIYKADGAGTREISRTKVGSEWKQPDDGSYGSEKYPSEMYVSGDRLAVLSTSYGGAVIYRGVEDAKAYIYPPRMSSYLCVDIYDISDVSNPHLISSLGQDGYSLATRMKDGRVYAVSNYYVYGEPDPDDPKTYVPCLYRGGTASAMSAVDICIMPVVDSTNYIVVTAYDLSSGTISASKCELGGGTTVYMSHDNLFIADQVYDDGAGEPYKDGIYTVVEYNNTVNTLITRFDISGGGLRLAAAGNVPGYLNDQFSMDEYNGYLRLVTTESSSRYKIYTDEEHGWSNYLWDENGNTTSNSLYVLDSSLRVAGSITGLAENERIYSARFDGDIGYFVTFRQVDPLFAVDLSNPNAPAILSALKIPGFSEYLHIWTDGRLFGLGCDADEDSGRTDGMKLSMFDVSDPANVTELKKLKLYFNYSTALYNHKAILVSYENNLIGFPTDTGYAVYGYSDDQGFTLKAEIDYGKWSGDARGLYIEDCLYIVGYSELVVLDMNAFTVLKRIAIDA